MLTLAESVTEVLANAEFDLFLKEGESPTSAQVVALINRARRIVNKRRYVYEPFLPLSLEAGRSRYGFESGAFAKRVIDVRGGWLNWIQTRNDLGCYGVWDRDKFEERFPNWPFLPPGTPTKMARFIGELVVSPAPTQAFIDLAKRAQQNRPVLYRIDLKAATGSTYKLTLNGQETSGLGPAASMASVTSALEALSNVAPGDVYVNLVDGTRHIYDFRYVTGSLVGSDIDLSITSNTLNGGTGTATCLPMGAFVQAQVIENDLTDGVDDDTVLPEPVALHYAVCELATVLSAKHMANEDEAWRRLKEINAGAGEAVEEEARLSRMAMYSLRNNDAARIHR